jgi:hypothetical protein
MLRPVENAVPDYIRLATGHDLGRNPLSTDEIFISGLTAEASLLGGFDLPSSAGMADDVFGTLDEGIVIAKTEGKLDKVTDAGKIGELAKQLKIFERNPRGKGPKSLFSTTPPEVGGLAHSPPISDDLAEVVSDGAAVAPNSVVGESANQSVYLVMSEKEFARVQANQGLATRPRGSSELGITLHQEYSADLMSRATKDSNQYKVVFEFEVSSGTWDSLMSQSATHSSAAELFPTLPAYRTGMQVPQVKLERGGVVSILLGNSESAIAEFNTRIIVIRKAN